MAAPSRELVLCARDRLLKAGNVTALVADRVWYRAPEGLGDSGYPHIANFDTFGIRDDATCITSEDITLNVHVWTRGGMDPLQDARSVAYEVGRALHGYPLPFPSNQLVTLDHRGDRIFYDRDDLTGHGVVEFRAIVRSNA
ncbi:MAG: DUF3168 domain-containing protein [Mesorhizobium sp.]